MNEAKDSLPTHPHMSNDEFRRRAHEVVDWIADYMRDVETHPVLSQCEPGDIRRALPDSPPEKPEPFETIMADFERLIVPGITHWQHPSFFAYFPANGSPASLLAEMLTAALGVNGMMWITSPAATELETHVLDWLRQALNLPEGWQGVIQDTASSASLCALLCAREKITGDSVNQRGFHAQSSDAPLIVYVSDQGHSSIEKGAKIAGFGRENVRKIPSDDEFAMDPAALERAISADREAGFRPAAICATVGTTSSTAIDPLDPIGHIAEKHDVWLHVDAALAGTAAILPEFRWMLDGVERADSFCFNPHKWMLTNFDCCVMFCRDTERLVRTFSITPEYLKTDAAGVIDYRDWGIPLGRRFRALKLWFVIRSYGLEGIRAYLREHIRLAQRFAEWIESDAAFEILAPHPLNTVCFRWIGDGSMDDPELDACNKKLLDDLNRSGKLFLTHTRLKGRFAIRLSIGQTYTTERHVHGAWEQIRSTAAGLRE